MIKISEEKENIEKIAESLRGIEFQLERMANFLDGLARDGDSLELYVRADAAIHEA